MEHSRPILVTAFRSPHRSESRKLTAFAHGKITTVNAPGFARPATGRKTFPVADAVWPTGSPQRNHAADKVGKRAVGELRERVERSKHHDAEETPGRGA